MFENKVSLLVKVVMGQNSTEPTQPLALSRSPRTLRKSASRDDSMGVLCCSCCPSTRRLFSLLALTLLSALHSRRLCGIDLAAS